MIIHESIYKDLSRIFIWFFLRYVYLALPEPLELEISRRLGAMHYRIDDRMRQVLKRNMRLVLKNPIDINKIVKLAFENHFVDQYFIFSLPRLTSDNISRYLSVEGLSYVDDALTRGRGVIIIHGHFGPRLLPLCYFGYNGYKVNQVGGPINHGLSKFGLYCAGQKEKLEKMLPARMIDGTRFLRPVFSALRRNEIVMMAGDGMGGGRFLGKQIGVSFLGNRLKFPLGPFILAKKTGAVLIPLFTIFDEQNGSYRSIIHPPQKAGQRLSTEEGVSYHVEKFVNLLETYVKEFPYLWHFWDEIFMRLDVSDACS